VNMVKSSKAIVSEHPVITREKRIVEAMLHLYCKSHHNSQGVLCSECNELLEYAKNRFDNCPFQEKKTCCGICGLSCYQPQMKEKATVVFTYSGPRMFFHHPVLAFHHICMALKEPQKINNHH